MGCWYKFQKSTYATIKLTSVPFKKLVWLQASPVAKGSPPCMPSASACSELVLWCTWAQTLGFETELLMTAQLFFFPFQPQVCPQWLGKMDRNHINLKYIHAQFSYTYAGLLLKIFQFILEEHFSPMPLILFLFPDNGHFDGINGISNQAVLSCPLFLIVLKVKIPLGHEGELENKSKPLSTVLESLSG